LVGSNSLDERIRISRPQTGSGGNEPIWQQEKKSDDVTIGQSGHMHKNS